MTKLRADLHYSHTIDVVENLSLWSIEVRVKTTIQDAEQLRYANDPSHEWVFVATVHPSFGSGERTAPLQLVQRTSGRNQLFTTFTRDNGQEDMLALDVEIE